MRLFIVFSSFIFLNFCFSQFESIGPIYGFPNTSKMNRACNFDSTFNYNTDTLNLPLFDDFSKNKFQVYTENYNDPSLVSEKYYKLLTIDGELNPIDRYYTAQPTFRRKINTTSFEVSEEIFPRDTLLVADFCFYPPVYTTTFVYPPYIIIDTVDFENPSDTIWLTEYEFFQDSATKFFLNVVDPTAYWIDSKAKHNYTNAVLPWSLGVVTFDGLDENGWPYNFGSNSNNYNDYLTSKPLFLGSSSPSDSIYLSFLYQAQGFNDEVESNDSLVLEFYAPILKKWEHIWSVSGQELSDFKVFHKRIIDTKYLKDGFQFRIKNYGSEAGALDQFHIDYVHLRKFSGYQDTLFKDFAIVYPIKSLLKTYTQIPWDHYKNSSLNLMSDNFEATVRNSSQVVENNQNGNVKITYQGASEGDFLLNGQTLSGGDINYAPRSFYTSFHNLNNNPTFQFDKAKSGKMQEFDIIMNASAQFPNFTQNDSTFYKQRFYDAYAYDDGSAEAAYGPEGVPNARLAFKFTPIENDSLLAIKIKFVPSVFNVSNELFYLTVWKDNNGKPGEVIYQDDFFNPRSPSYNYDDTLGFTTYYLKDTSKLAINGTFYIGWKQEGIRRLNVGMDMNIDNSDKIFYSVNNEFTWQNTIYEGSILMRPVFSTELNADLSISEKTAVSSLKIYPNPSEGIFIIQSEDLNYSGIDVYDLRGSLVFSSNEKRVDLQNNESGVYFLKDRNTQKCYKIIKK
jgi:hypothetical protein